MATARLRNARDALESDIARMPTRLREAVATHAAGAQQVLCALNSACSVTHAKAAAWSKQWDDCAEYARVTAAALFAYASACAAYPVNVAEADTVLDMAPCRSPLRTLVFQNSSVFCKFGWIVRLQPSATKSRSYVPVRAADGQFVFYVDVRDETNASIVSYVKDKYKVTRAASGDEVPCWASVIKGNIEFGVPNLRTAYGRLLRVCCWADEPVTHSACGVVLGRAYPHECSAWSSHGDTFGFQRLSDTTPEHLASISPCGNWFVHCIPVISVDKSSVRVTVMHKAINPGVQDDAIEKLKAFKYYGYVMRVLATPFDTVCVATHDRVDEFSVLGKHVRMMELPIVVAAGERLSHVLLAWHGATLAVMQCVQTVAGKFGPRRLSLFEQGKTTSQTYEYHDMLNDAEFLSMAFACNGKALVLFAAEPYALLLSRLWRSWSWIPLGVGDKTIVSCGMTRHDEIALFGVGGWCMVTLMGDIVAESWLSADQMRLADPDRVMKCVRFDDDNNLLALRKNNLIVRKCTYA